VQCDPNSKKVQVFKDLNTNNKQSLVDIRIIQKNLIYLIGLSPSISNSKTTLQKPEYLGQYGVIQKMIIITSHNFNPPSNAAYVTFSNEKEASLAILVINPINVGL
jgi:CCR4-NOT transcription complex subunit 4